MSNPDLSNPESSTEERFRAEMERLFAPSPEEFALREAVKTRSRLNKLLVENKFDRRWMSAEEQIQWIDASQPHSIVGTSYFIGGSGEQGEFTCFHFDGIEYYKNEKGVYAYDSERNLAPCDDPRVRSSIRLLEEHESKVVNARDQLAERYAEGDKDLEWILRVHLEYNGGKIESFIHEGILLFQVGRNASHDFYAGSQNGKRYVLASGEGSGKYDEDGKLVREPEIEHSLRILETRDSWGYLGHF